ncbi:DNA polymerase III subunit beta [Buchnera aphidicola]|uniref:DNA polymerase III subunit beta n=1 Tax=Buchnera aphidicola TaxID=9 RepID=UPI003464E802
MKFNIHNKILIEHLHKIYRLLTKNISLPILENILFNIEDGTLSLTASNLELELISNITINTEYQPGKITVSGRKLLNICRHIPKNSVINIQLIKSKIHVKSDNSHYILTTLSPDNFPQKKQFNCISEFFINSHIFKDMIDKTEFSMGKQDIRYYLNGVLLEKKGALLQIVATDGYRLALSHTLIKKNIIDFSVIIPRKGIVELSRLLNIAPQLIHIIIGNNNIKININNLIFTAQLLEGKYPDYNSVLFQSMNNPVIINTIALKNSLSRTAILSHEKFCGVDINIGNNQCKITSDNQEEETAKDVFNINYSQTKIEFSINVYYILDILNVIKSENILLFINPSQSSIQITEENDNSNLYIVMLLKS